MSVAAALVATLVTGTAAAQAVSCEQLRADIESRVRAKGVASAVVSVVEEATAAPGQRVGSCEGGRKKLLLTRGGSAAAGSSAAPSLPASAAQPAATAAQATRPRPRPAVITECADGRVITDGSCKR